MLSTFTLLPYSVDVVKVPAEHLLSAAVMSAPAALAVAKMSYPETEKSVTKTQEDIILGRP